MCLLTWYDKAAQPHNMTFSQVMSSKFSNFNFYIARVIQEGLTIWLNFTPKITKIQELPGA